MIFAAAFTTVIDLAHAVSGCLAFGILTAVAHALTRKETAPMPAFPAVSVDADPTPAPPSAAEHAMDMVRGGIMREYRLLPGPLQRMEFLHLIRMELTDLHTLASQELYKQQSQHPLTHPSNFK